MDAPLSSSRQGNSGGGGGGGGYHHGRHGGGGGGGGRRHYRYGGGRHHHGGRGRGGRGGGRWRDHRRHHDHHHRPYARPPPPRRDDRRDRPAGNRFSARADDADPERDMLRMLSAMVARMGDWCSASTASSSGTADAAARVAARRDAADAIARNVRDLAGVLSRPATAPQFLGHSGDGVGPLATLVAGCAHALPTQTTAQAALTAATERAVAARPEASARAYEGFPGRCVGAACRRLGADLRAVARRADADAWHRSKLTLRWLAVSVKAGYVCWEREEPTEEEDAVMEEETKADAEAEPQKKKKDVPKTSLRELLEWLAESCASLGGNRGALLGYLVTSTLPWLLDAEGVDRGVLEDLVNRVDAADYTSPFKPGVGPLAVLLRDEPVDEGEDDDDEDDEEEDEDEDEEQCCDSYQESVRTVRALLEDPSAAMYEALTDAPWNGPSDDAKDDDDDDDETKDDAPPPLRRWLLPVARPSLEDLPPLLPVPRHPLADIVHGRLPLHPLPDDDDDEEEDRGPYAAAVPAAARALLHEAVREAARAHLPTVSASGAERGSAADAAAQAWSAREAFAGAPGAEHGVVECALGDVAASSSRPVRAGRLLFELARARPREVPGAAVAAATRWERDACDAGAPAAADRVAGWLAAHLTDTDFQWPAACWRYWGDETREGLPRHGNKRRFLRRLVRDLAALNGADAVRNDCLPENSPLARWLDDDDSDDDDDDDPQPSSEAERELERELRDKIHVENETPANLETWLAETEESLRLDDDGDDPSRRVRLVVRTVLSPPSVRRGKDQDNDQDMNDDDQDVNDQDDKNDGDPLRDLLSAVERYAPLIRASSRDKEEEIGAVVPAAADAALRRRRVPHHVRRAVRDALVAGNAASPRAVVDHATTRFPEDWDRRVVAAVARAAAFRKGESFPDAAARVAAATGPLAETVCRRVARAVRARVVRGTPVPDRRAAALLEGLRTALSGTRAAVAATLLRRRADDDDDDEEARRRRVADWWRERDDDDAEGALGAERWRTACVEAARDDGGEGATELVARWILPWIDATTSSE